MRVLHVIPSVDARFGGPSQSVAGLLAALEQTAPAGTGLTLASEHRKSEPALPDALDRKPIRYLARRFWVPCPASITRLWREVKQAQIVHVHSYWNALTTSALAMARRAGRPVVLSPRGSLHRDAVTHSSTRAKWVFAAMGGHRQLAGVSGFHFQSEAEAAHSLTGQRSPSSIIIDNGVTLPPRTSEAARTRLFPGRGLHLLYLGRINAIKGIDLQIRALYRLRASGIEAVLHLVGPDDGELPRLQQLAQELGIAPYLHAHGPVFGPAKYDWLAAADAVLMSSEFENNSNTALEAMAAGGVLIATPGCAPMQAAEAGTAVTCSRSATALAEAIAALKQRDTKAIRQNARRYVAEHYDWESRGREMWRFYESLM